MFFEAVVVLQQEWPWFWPLWAAVFGGVLGSFIGCMWDRWPQGMSLRYPPSSCLSCHTVLGVIDLLPIVSWLGLGGRCRHCNAPIPARTLWLELGFSLGFVSIVWWLF